MRGVLRRPLHTTSTLILASLALDTHRTASAFACPTFTPVSAFYGNFLDTQTYSAFSQPPNFAKMPKSRSGSGLFSTRSHQPASTTATQLPSTFLDGHPLPSLLVFDLDYTLWPFWVDTHCTPPLKPANSSTSTKSSKSKSKDNLSDHNTNTAMLDAYNESFSFYAEVPTVLAAAKARGVLMSVASRTHAPDLAAQMLRGLYVPPLQAQESNGEADSSSNSNGAGGQFYEHASTTHSSTSSSNPQKRISPSDLITKESSKPTRALDFFAAPQMYPGSKVTHFINIQKSILAKQGKEIPFGEMIFFDDEFRNHDVERELGVIFVLVRDGVSVAEVDRGVREWRKRRGLPGGSS